MLAFLFPGQGVELTRHELCVLERSASATALLDHACRLAGTGPGSLLERGVLERTGVLQPVLTAVTMGIHRVLCEAGAEPDVVAGHSLGEIAACGAAGCMAGRDAVDLAGLRGRLMEDLSRPRPGGMLALTGCTREDVALALESGRRAGRLDMAAHNSPDEWVLSGDEEALQVVARSYRSVRLSVSGAWHGSRMEPGVETFERSAGLMTMAPPEKTLVSGRTGAPVTNERLLPGLLARQLVEPVLWARVMCTIADLGVTDIVTVGPGKVLRGLVRKNLGGTVRVHSTGSPGSVDRTLEAILA